MVTGILVSVNYSDFLAFVLPRNISQFDKIIVLTIKSDKECQKICKKYKNVLCLVFEDEIIKKNNKSFNKGALLNKALEYLDSINYSSWLVFTDSDILFPSTFKKMVDDLPITPNVLFSLDRYDFETYSQYSEFEKTSDLSLLGNKYYCSFAGYCQVFLYRKNQYYLTEYADACDVDWIFLKKFGRTRLSKRKVLCSSANPEPHPFKYISDTEYVIHLGVEGENHFGRKTVTFKFDN